MKVKELRDLLSVYPDDMTILLLDSQYSPEGSYHPLFEVYAAKADMAFDWAITTVVAFEEEAEWLKPVLVMSP